MKYWWFGVTNARKRDRKHLYPEFQPILVDRAAEYVWRRDAGPHSQPLYEQMKPDDKVVFWMGHGVDYPEWGILGTGLIKRIDDVNPILIADTVPDSPLTPYCGDPPVAGRVAEVLKTMFGLDFPALRDTYLALGWRDKKTRPVTVDEISNEQYDGVLRLLAEYNIFPDESGAVGFKEGGRLSRFVNAYERSPEAREACLKHYGTLCQVCGLSFEDRYGPIGFGFIHVHHVVPLSEIGAEYKVDPIKDLRPVCPNCHAMLHRPGSPPLTIEKLRTMMKCA